MLKTKSQAVKKPALGSANRFRIAPITKASHSRKFAAPQGVTQQQRLNTFIRGLKSQIARLTDYIANEPLTRDESLFYLSQLHTLNVLRDKLELKKAGTSNEEIAKISLHLGKKMQSSFSD